MKDILSEIVANKQVEVEKKKQQTTLEELMEHSHGKFEHTVVSMRDALEKSPTGIIAEFKRKSPSKGWLFPNAKVENVLPTYEQYGASACSVLTDEIFFGGTLDDLRQARRLVKLPLLRKDFIIDEYQLYEARLAGADAVLLIAAVLSAEMCARLAEKAHSLGLEVLLEVHDESELAHINNNIDMLGVNNRHLGTFHTDVQNSFLLYNKMQEISAKSGYSPLLVSESGISDPHTVSQLRKAGFKGFLIGECFMKTPQPGLTLAGFIKEV